MSCPCEQGCCDEPKTSETVCECVCEDEKHPCDKCTATECSNCGMICGCDSNEK